MARQAPAPTPAPTAIEWAPDYPVIMRDRLVRLNKLQGSDKLLQATKLHYAHHPQGHIHFIEDWMMTNDSRRVIQKLPADIPFVPWPKQREFLMWIRERMEAGEDGLVEKSRDAGATWLAIAYGVWAWIFIPGFSMGLGSRKEQLVDRLGDMDSLFEKARYMIEHLPIVFLPPGFVASKHSSFLKIMNPRTKATITGEAGDNIGRGGRNSIYVVDEAAHLERPKKVDAALSANTPCRIDISTPAGTGNPFHQKRMRGHCKVFIFDWSDDPRKGPEWYAREKKRLDPVTFAQEVDRDYEASAEGVLIPAKWVRAAMGLQLTTTGMPQAGLDVADEGPDSNALIIRTGPTVTLVEDWKRGTTTQTTRRAAHTCQLAGCDEVRFDSIGVGAGVKGESKRDAGGITWIGIASGGKVVNPNAWAVLPSKSSKGIKNKDFFFNRKAQMWWGARERFRRTYEHVTGEQEYHHDDLISLPADAYELQMELSGPQYDTNNGKIKIEKKEHMKARGLVSPNKGDALVLAFAPVVQRRLTW